MKKIAISQRVIIEKIGDKINRKDALEQDYINYYQRFGMILIPIPNVLANVKGYLEDIKIDGLILSGGNNINPKLYTKKEEIKEKEKNDYADERDCIEKEMFNYAIEKKLPILCECRGIEFMNIYFGGRLIKVKDTVHLVKTHKIKFVDKEFKSYFNRKYLDVNSYHTYGFMEKEKSKELITFAKSTDNIIEGVYHKSLPILGIMWHPERKTLNKEFDDFNKKLVYAFLNNDFIWGKT